MLGTNCIEHLVNLNPNSDENLMYMCQSEISAMTSVYSRFSYSCTCMTFSYYRFSVTTDFGRKTWQPCHLTTAMWNELWRFAISRSLFWIKQGPNSFSPCSVNPYFKAWRWTSGFDNKYNVSGRNGPQLSWFLCYFFILCNFIVDTEIKMI